MQVELLDFAKEILGYYGLLAIVTIYFFYNLPRFFDSVSYLNSRKIKSLEEALKSSYLSEFDEKVIKDSLSDYYLKKATNLSIDNRTKIDCLDLYNKLSEKFTLLEIGKALQIIDISVINFDRHKLVLEHLRLSSKKSKVFSKLILTFIFTYTLSIVLSLLIFILNYQKIPKFNILGAIYISISDLALVLITLLMVIVMFGSTVKAIKRMKNINIAIDFLKSRVPPQT